MEKLYKAYYSRKQHLRIKHSNIYNLHDSDKTVEVTEVVEDSSSYKPLDDDSVFVGIVDKWVRVGTYSGTSFVKSFI